MQPPEPSLPVERRRPVVPPAEPPRHAWSSSAATSSAELRAAAEAAAADEVRASAVRQRLHTEGLPWVDADATVAPLLWADEHVVAVRRDVAIERRTTWVNGGLRGDLYLTTQRLLHLGAIPVAYPISDVRDAVVATGLLRLAVSGGRGVEVDVPDPRVLRVELGAVRSAVRGGRALPGQSSRW